MATQSLTYKPVLTRGSRGGIFARMFNVLAKRLTPRPHVISSAGLFLVGVGIMFFMLLELIPATFFFGFVGFAFITTGGILLLYYL